MKSAKILLLFVAIGLIWVFAVVTAVKYGNESRIQKDLAKKHGDLLKEADKRVELARKEFLATKGQEWETNQKQTFKSEEYGYEITLNCNEYQCSDSPPNAHLNHVTSLGDESGNLDIGTFTQKDITKWNETIVRMFQSGAEMSDGGMFLLSLAEMEEALKMDVGTKVDIHDTKNADSYDSFEVANLDNYPVLFKSRSHGDQTGYQYYLLTGQDRWLSITLTYYNGQSESLDTLLSKLHLFDPSEV